MGKVEVAVTLTIPIRIMELRDMRGQSKVVRLDPDALYTLKHAAQVARCSAATVRNDIDSGRCGGVKLSDGSRVVPGVALVEYVRTRRGKGGDGET